MTAAGNPYLWIAAAVAAIAAGLLVSGIRGRSVPPRRVCRRCGYEVGEQAVCPECGRDLGGRRGARVVRRRARRRLVVAGSSLLGVAVLGAATLLILAARGVDLNPYKPVWLLMWEAQSASPAAADSAAEELCRRRFAGDMPDSAADRVLAMAMAVHADPSRHWPGPLSAFIDEGMLSGRMDAEETRRYFENLAAPVLVLPQGPPPRAGAPLTLALDHRWRAGMRAPGRGRAFGLWVTIQPALPAEDASPGTLILLPQQPDKQYSALKLDIPEDAQRVEAKTRIRYELNLAEQGFGPETPIARLLNANPGLGSFQREVSLAFEVAPAPKIDITLDSSTSFIETLKDLLAPELVDGGRGRIMCRFQPAELPVGVAFSAAFRDPETGAEWPTWIVLQGRERVGAHNHLIPLKGFEGNRLDLILRPDIERLRNDLRAQREDASWTIFGEELVLDGLLIKSQ